MEERRESRSSEEGKKKALQQAGGMLFLEDQKRELGSWKPGSRLFSR